MKTAVLKELGLSKEQIDKIMEENGKDIAREQAKISAPKGYGQKAEDALAEEFFGAKAYGGHQLAAEEKSESIEELKAEIARLKAEMAVNAQAFEAKFNEVSRRSLVEKRLGEEEFSSKYAEKGVLEEILAAEFVVENGVVLGLEEIIAEIKLKNPDAFRLNKNMNILGMMPPAGNMEIDDTKSSIRSAMGLLRK